MKKFLLLSMTACAVLSASAISVKSLDTNASKASVSLRQNKVMTPKSYAQIATNIFDKKSSSKVRVKLPSADNIYGMYVCDVTDEGDGTTSFISSSTLNFTEANFVDEETGDVFNVEIDGFFGYASVYGSFDEATGTLTIPAQYCYEHPEYGQLAFFAITEADPENNSYGVANTFALQLEEDENGFYFVPAEGYIGYCTAFQEGEYANSLADIAYNDLTVMPANYIVQGESINHLDGSDWEDVDDYGVCLERIGDDALFIHGFMGMGTVEAKFDEEGNGTIETYQPLLYAQVERGVWDYIGPIAWDVDGQNIRVNPNREYISCGFYTFTYNETGEQVDAFALYGADGWEYYSLGRKGLDGGFPPLTVLTLMVDNPNMPFSDGISNIQLVKPATKGTFNLAGQRVRNAKGIVIEDGKKVVR